MIKIYTDQEIVSLDQEIKGNMAIGGYFGLCAIGGLLSAGTTHLAITPLDVVKVNMQVHPVKYHSICTCFTTLLREQGPSAFWRGWTGKFFGYGAQGACRFGLYEYFKNIYSNALVDQNRSLIFFLSSASAEVIASSSIESASIASGWLTIKKIGFANLFTRSLPIRIMLVGPAVTLQWLFFDTIKVLSGLSNNTPLVHNFNIPTLRESSSGTACGYENVSS
ncbi:hypothetical protein Leryth_008174 [Lithospermum erythrorhizon]|nr:hypothetical protein Leryth_008174 [Lithospermum erythrorhizon]